VPTTAGCSSSTHTSGGSLYESARAIMLRIPHSEEEFSELVLETCRRNGLRDAYIRLVVSRGRGDLGLDPAKCPDPSVVIIADEIQLYPSELYEEGLTVGTVATRRNGPEAEQHPGQNRGPACGLLRGHHAQ